VSDSFSQQALSCFLCTKPSFPARLLSLFSASPRLCSLRISSLPHIFFIVGRYLCLEAWCLLFPKSPPRKEFWAFLAPFDTKPPSRLGAFFLDFPKISTRAFTFLVYSGPFSGDPLGDAEIVSSRMVIPRRLLFPPPSRLMSEAISRFPPIPLPLPTLATLTLRANSPE